MSSPEVGEGVSTPRSPHPWGLGPGGECSIRRAVPRGLCKRVWSWLEPMPTAAVFMTHRHVGFFFSVSFSLCLLFRITSRTVCIPALVSGSAPNHPPTPIPTPEYFSQDTGRNQTTENGASDTPPRLRAGWDQGCAPC